MIFVSSSSLSWVYSVELKSGIESLVCEVVRCGKGWYADSGNATED